MDNRVLINRYRQHLLGVATLGVLFVHSIDIVPWPYYLSELFT